MCIFEVLVVEDHDRSSPYNLSIRNRHKEVENKSGERISRSPTLRHFPSTEEVSPGQALSAYKKHHL